jgi:Tol biopolymer transport system component
MTRSSFSRLATLSAVAFFALASGPAASEAQGYFGRNKVQYESFKWRILRSEHFDNFFYPAESLLVHDGARLAERWYTRHSETFRHAFDRKSLIFYADAPDFQQTNVISEQLEEGTGGVTEGLRTRVIMPFTGIYSNNDHVLGHELVHVFQYNIAEGAGGLQRLDALPLWLIEGMAEHFSVGRNDALTAMWMRDAVMRDKFPTIEQLTTDPRFFPYRYGEALWAYVGGRWGDRAVVDVYRTSLRLGWDQALIRVLGMNSDSLSKEWAAANKATYLATAQSRTHPDSVGRPVVPLARSNDYNVSPSISPDGKLVAFFSSRDLFGIDLFLADAQTGKVIKKLASSSSDRHIDAISFINSSGDWSPDGSKFAFIAYANGDNQIAVLDTRSADVERRISLGEVGAVSSLAWSPDGNTLLIAGQEGGKGDLWLLDLKSEQMTRLTDDRFADFQPTFSPDGRSIAWSTDRASTDFDIMKWGRLQLATMDLATKTIRTLATFPRGRAINPQYAPDGQNIFFIADQDGIPDIYRLDLASGQTFRLTKVSTGISGITSDSPALSVARASGRMAFTVFKDQGFGIFAFDPSELTGTPEPGQATGPSLSELPPYAPNSLVQRYLGDPADGLVSGADFQITDYHSSFQLDAIGQPQFGASIGGPFGAGVVGGVSALWGDQLGDRQIFGAIQANGTVKDIGGAVQYYNLRDRWNWGVGAQHMPYLSGGSFGRDTVVTTTAGPANAQNIYLVLQRIYLDQASFFAQYPFSTTRRFEASLGATHQYYSQEIIRYTFVGNQLFEQERSDASDLLGTDRGITYAEPSLAFVGDNSFSAYTSPVAGERFRLSYSPVIGDFMFQTVTADYRRYFFMRPFSLAFRGMHYGRYGKDSEDSRLWPLFLGEETFIRGYGYGSIEPDECIATTQSTCPVFDRLLGSRVIVGNAEFRIPLFGSPEFGLVNFPFVPIEVSPFFDAGVAYSGNQNPDFRFTRTGSESATAGCENQPATGANSQFIVCTDRIPVFSSGVSMRANVLGYLILEAYIAHPFQRPARNWVWGFQLAPGW